MFGNLVNELLPSFQEEEDDSSEAHAGNDILPNGTSRIQYDASKSAQGPLFPEVDALLSLFKDSCRELVDLQQQVHLVSVGGDLERVIFCLFSESFNVSEIFLYYFALKIDGKLYNLKKEVSIQDSKHRKTLAEVSN